MDGSGLTDALETSYAANAVVHMITGKAISRSLRGHFLVEAALKSRLFQPLIPAQTDYSVEEKGSDKYIEMADDNVNLSNSDEELNFTASMDEVCETREPGKILSYMRNLLSSSSIYQLTMAPQQLMIYLLQNPSIS